MRSRWTTARRLPSGAHAGSRRPGAALRIQRDQQQHCQEDGQRAAVLRTRLVHGVDDVARGDAVAVEQLLGRAAARNLRDREAAHGEAGGGDRRRHRVADAARPDSGPRR